MREGKIKSISRIIALILALLLVVEPLVPNVVYASDTQDLVEDNDNTGKTEIVSQEPQRSEEVEQEILVPETQPEVTQPEERSPVDWTNQAEELQLTLERVIYDHTESGTSQKKVIPHSEGVLDLQTMELDKALNIYIELGFFSMRDQATRQIKGGDIFCFNLPKEYFSLTNTTAPVPVLNRSIEDVTKETDIKIAEYVIVDNKVMVTFADVVNGESLDSVMDLIGRIAFPVTIIKEALSQKEATVAKIELQQGRENRIVFPIQKSIENSIPNGTLEVVPDSTIETIPEVSSTSGEEDVLPKEVESSIDTESESENISEKGTSASRILKKVVRFFADLGFRAGEEQQTISQTIKKPIQGIDKVKIQIVSNKDGYTTTSTDLAINFGIDITLNDDFLYKTFSKFEMAPDFPKFDGNTEEFNKEVDNYLSALSTEKLPTIKYSYDLGTDITVPNGTPINVPLKAGDKEVATLTVEKQENGHCVVTVVFEKWIYNRDSVAAGGTTELEIEKSALKEDEKVNVGFKDQQLVVATEEYLNEDKPGESPKIDYKVNKTAPEKVDTPFIDYEIKVDTLDNGKSLKGYFLEDVLPKSEDGSMKLEVVSFEVDGKKLEKSSGAHPSYGQYVINQDTSTLLYQFPNEDVKSAVIKVRLALDQSSYQAYVQNPQGIDIMFSNKAILKDKQSNPSVKIESQSAETEMKMQFMSKEGKPEGLNGLRYLWTLDINTKFTSGVDAYVVDTICWDDHRYDGTTGILVYEDGKYTKTLTNIPDLTDQIKTKPPYTSIGKGNVAALAEGQAEPFYYRYTTDNKEYAVLIIPYGNAFQNKNIKFKYYTDIWLDGKSPSEWLTGNEQTKHITNDAKFLWNRFTYGNGIGLDDFDGFYNINKEVNTKVTLGTKEASTYDEVTQNMQWKFTLNGYGAHLTETKIEDELSSIIYDWNGLSLEVLVYDRGSNIVTGIEISQTPNDRGMYYEREGDKLVIHVGELRENDFYEINLNIKVKEIKMLAQQGNKVGQLSNSALITAKVNGQEKSENILEVKKDIPNTLIEKEAVGGYNYETKELNWKTKVDINHIPITGAVIKDDLPIGSSFKELTRVTRFNSITKKQEIAHISGTANENNIEAVFKDTRIKLHITEGKNVDSYVEDKVDFTILDSSGHPLNDDKTSYILEYSTKVMDDNWLKTHFKSEGIIKIINKVALTGTISGTQINANAAANGEIEVKSDKIKKNGKYYPSEGNIRWNITFNQARLDLTGMTLIEEIGEQPLEIDMDSVALYEVGKNGASKLLKSVEKNNMEWLNEINPKNIKYIIPAEYKEKTLKLTFDTALTKDEALVSDIHNSAKLMKGNEIYQESEDSNGGYTGEFDMDNYVKAAKKPVFQIIKISQNDDPDSKKPPIAGAKFELLAYTKQGQGYMLAGKDYNKSGITGADGKITFVNLKKEYVYELKEIEAPAGYERITTSKFYLFRDGALTGSTISLKVNEKEQTVVLMKGDQGAAASDSKDFNSEYLIIQNTPATGMEIQFTKETPDKGRLAGCQFWLVDIKERLQTQKITSTSNGTVAFSKVDPGSYKLIEWTSVNPYMQGAVFNVTMNADGTYIIEKNNSDDGNAEISGSQGSYIITNKYVEGTIKIKKVDDQNGQIPLAGATFTLTGKNESNEDISIESRASGADGIAVFSNVPYSNENGYTITETTPPFGYRNDNQVNIQVTQEEIQNSLAGQAGEEKTFVIDLMNEVVENTRTKGRISFTKLDDPQDTGIAAAPLAGRTFELYYNDNDGYAGYIKGETLIATETTTGSAPNLVFNNIPYGNYVLKEVIKNTDDKNYKLCTPIKITLRDKMQTSLDENRSEGNASDDNVFAVTIDDEIKNSLLQGSFSIEKKDISTEELLKDVKFNLKGKNAVGGAVDITQITNTNGKATFSNIPIGANNGETPYTLTETKVDGYSTPSVFEVYVKPNNGKAMISIKLNNTKTTITNKPYQITNTPVKGSISLTKVNETGVGLLEDAQFTLYRVVNGVTVTDSDKAALAPRNGTTDGEGKLTFDNVEYGNYILKETKAPNGYKLSTKEWKISKTDLLLTEPDKDSFTCESWTKAAQGKISNEPTNLQITKVDTAGKAVIGANLKISGKFSDGSTIIEWQSKDSSNKEFYQLLIVGETYTIEETIASSSSYKSIQPITFEVRGDGTLEIESNNTSEYQYGNGVLEIIDPFHLAPVELTKTDSKTEEGLAGVEFDLYQQLGEDPKPETDKKINTNSIVTDAYGKWNSAICAETKDDLNVITGVTLGAGLSKGNYYFVETKALDSHVTDKTPVKFSITDRLFEGDKITPAKADMKNTLVNASVSLIKLDAKDGHKIPDTVFRLVKPNGVTEEKCTDTNGKLTFDGLGKGVYTLTEITANSNYLLGTPFVCTFTVTDICQDQILAICKNNTNIERFDLKVSSGNWTENGITNERKLGTVSLVKKGEVNAVETPLEGAVFGLFYSKDYTPVQVDGIDIIAITDAKGIITISDLAWDKYYLQEIIAPDGFALDNTKLEFEITYNSLEKAFSAAAGGSDIINKATKVTIEKSDIDTAVGLKGAVFTIKGKFKTGQAEETRTYDMTNTESLTLYKELLNSETYTLAEIKAPAGYELAKPVEFTVLSNGKIENVTDNILLVKDKPIDAGLKKISTVNGHVLTGGSYTVAPTEGSIFAKTTEKSITVTEDNMKEKLSRELVAENTYVLAEIKAPEGYKVADPVTFHVGSNGIITIAESDKEIASVEEEETIILKDEPNRLKISKVDENGKQLEGATFSLAGVFADGTTIKSWTSTEQAYELEAQLIAENMYTLKEIKAPDGYQRLQEEVTFISGKNGDITIREGAPGINAIVTADGITIQVKNIATKFYLDKISDVTDQEGALLSEKVVGATLDIVKDKDGQPDSKVVRSWTSDGQDVGKMIKLPAGIYWIVERLTPYGYVTADPVKFELKDDNTIISENVASYEENSVTYSLLTIVDPVIYGQVELTKIEKGKPDVMIGGVTFSLYKKGVQGTSDILIAEGLTTEESGIFKSTRAVDILNLETGKALSKGLRAGDYYFRETATCDNYLLNSTQVLGEFTIKGDQEAANKEFERLVKPPAVENELFETYIKFQKVDYTNGVGLDSTEFTLYKKITEESWEEVGVPVVTDQVTGEVLFTIKEKGTYQIKETKVAPGYLLDNAKPFTAEFTVDNKNEFQKKTLVIQADESGTLNMEDVNKYDLIVSNGIFHKKGSVANERILGTLTLKKADDISEEALSGVTFTLYQKNEGQNIFDKIADFLTGKQYKAVETMNWTEVAGTEGELYIEGLDWGAYYIQESAVSSGYVLGDEKYSFHIGRLTNEIVLEVDIGTIKNTKTRIFFEKYGKLIESCADAEIKDYSEPLAGAEFTAYIDPECTKPVEVKAAVKGNTSVSSVDTGMVEFIGFPADATYYIKETKAPDGYQSNQNIYAAILDKNGEYKGLTIKSGPALDEKQEVENVKNGKVVNDLYRVDISLKKVSEQDNSNTRPDAVYGLFKKEVSKNAEEWIKVAEATTDKNGMLIFKGVLANVQYKIEELKAPEGSHISAKPIEVEFETIAGDDGTQKMVLKAFNNGEGTAKVDPETGDIIWLEPAIMLGFSKQDTKGNLLEGAKLELQDMNGAVIEAWTSEQEVHIVYADKKEGKILAGEKYQLVEKEAPKGYKIAEPVEFIVEERVANPGEAYVQSVVMIDELITPKGDQDTGNSKKAAAKTGDQIPILPYVVAMVLAIGTATQVRRKKRKQ